MSQQFAPSRRQLVLGGAVLAAALPGASATAMLDGRPLPYMDSKQWKREVGVDFAVASEAGAVPMKLMEVKGEMLLRAPRPGVRKSSFTVVFEMDAAQAPEGGKTYQVRHPSLGTAALYLQRADLKNGRARLRASFS